MCTQDLLPGGISLNSLRSTPGYCVDQITFSIGSIINGTVYHIMLLIVKALINSYLADLRCTFL